MKHRGIKLGICALLIAAFIVSELTEPHPTPIGMILAGTAVTLFPFAAIYFLYLLLAMIGKRKTAGR